MKKYDHKKIEKKWQSEWEKSGLYKIDESSGKPKCYVLDMFPYPSGEGLHVGHPKGYIATDIYSRFKRMQGSEILHPMGWDAFGLPAENFAIKNKVHPRNAVEKNIAYFKEQLEKIGFNYDWSREINTTDPSYYKWTQWIFLQLFKKGFAYESHEPINWCPSCQTGLANEDLEDGKCERCGSIVEKRPIRQWVLKITEYADRLLNDLEKLPAWPEHVKESQRNWIGRSEGVRITFPLTDAFGQKDCVHSIPIFTTRPETIFGATFIAVSPELARKWMSVGWQAKADVRAYIGTALKKRQVAGVRGVEEKTGIEAGITAVNPANKETIPIWIADYVLGDIGTGAIMAVPAHDERDFAFAKTYSLPIREVIVPERIDKRNPPVKGKDYVTRRVVQAYVRDQKTGTVLILKWKKHSWTTFPMGGIEEGESVIEAARREVREETGYTNLSEGVVCGGAVRAEFFAAHKNENRIAFTHLVCFDLRNDVREEVAPEEKEMYDVLWVKPSEVTPVSMTHAEMDVWVERLKEPKDEPYTGEGVCINSHSFDGLVSEEARQKIVERVDGTPMTTYKLRDWVFSRQRYWGEPIPIIHCETCGATPVPERDLPVVLPLVEHYEPSGTGESPLAAIPDFVHTTCPKCGGLGKRETNTMPQWAGSCWYYLRFMDPKNDATLVDTKKEKYWAPVDLYVGGAEHATRHLIYARFWHKFLFDIGVVSTEEPFERLQSVGLILAPDGRKMSKRFGNVINPDDIVERFGADTFRVYEMFMGPFSDTILWSTDNMVGSRRFLEKVWRLLQKVTEKETLSVKVETLLQRTIKKVGEDIEALKCNTAISSLMILVNAFDTNDMVSRKEYEILLQLLSPFAPHITEELWSTLGHTTSIHREPWPRYDTAKALMKISDCVVSINGKVRATLSISDSDTEEKIKEKALALPQVEKWIQGKEIKRIVYVPRRILNIVVGD